MTAEILGTIVGIIYLYWEYKADPKLWIAGIIMPAISLVVYWQTRLYADFAINVYFLLAAIYGLFAWRRTTPDAAPPPITPIPTRHLIHSILITLFSWAIIAHILTTYTDSDVPLCDALTTALSITGMWMLARKWLQQWLAWIIVDALSAALYVYKGIYLYAALYAAYTIIAIFGYRQWKRLMTGHPK